MKYDLGEGAVHLGPDICCLIYKWKREFEMAEQRAKRELIILRQEMYLEWRKEAFGDNWRDYCSEF